MRYTIERAMPPRRVDPRAVAAGTALADILAHYDVASRARVTIDHDGKRLSAFDGEPLAISLMAHGRTTLARSIKFHRPRGPCCLRGACDGCLTRVDGVPNVMACRVPAREGAAVISQNAFPTAKLDVLRVTDWFFPKHFDHHHLLVKWGRAVNATMQVFARRMAGLGTMPETDGPVVPPEIVDADVLVVGAGVAGLAVATLLARSKLSVVCVEEHTHVGGMLLDGLQPLEDRQGARVPATLFAHALGQGAHDAGVRLFTQATACATFDNGTLVMAADRALLVRTHARVFANGCCEQVGSFENNDMPGIYTARAAAVALSHGVAIGDRVVIAGAVWPVPGVSDALLQLGATVIPVEVDSVVSAGGGARVTSVTVRDGDKTRKLRCDTLVVANEPTPAYELLGQAGVAAHAESRRGCFVPVCDDSDGSTERDDVFAIGSVAGTFESLGPVDLRDPLSAAGPVARARRVANALLTRRARAAT